MRLVAHVSTSAPDTDVVARLSLTCTRTAFAQRLCDGMIRLRYRDGFAHALPVEAGEVYEVEVAMWDTAQRVLPGHRIRLEIASAAFPKHEVNLGTGGDVITETGGVPAANTLWHSRERPSRLIVRTRRAS